MDIDIALDDCVRDVHLGALPLAICDRGSMSVEIQAKGRFDWGMKIC